MQNQKEEEFIPQSLSFTVTNHYSEKSTLISASRDEIESTLKLKIFNKFSTLNQHSIFYFLALKISEMDNGKGKFIKSMDLFQEQKLNFFQNYQGTKKFDVAFSWTDEEDSSSFLIEMWIYTNNTIQYNFDIFFDTELIEN